MLICIWLWHQFAYSNHCGAVKRSPSSVIDKFLCLPAADADCAGRGGDEGTRLLMERRSWAWWTRMERARHYPQTWQSLSTSTPYKSCTSVGVLTTYNSGDRGLFIFNATAAPFCLAVMAECSSEKAQRKLSVSLQPGRGIATRKDW